MCEMITKSPVLIWQSRGLKTTKVVPMESPLPLLLKPVRVRLFDALKNRIALFV